MIRLKIKNDENITKYISLIRKYNHNLSIADIKTRIEKSDWVIEHSLISRYDVCDDLAGIDRNMLFHELVTSLFSLGATIELFENNEPISVEYLNNRLACIKEIEQEILQSRESELEEE